MEKSNIFISHITEEKELAKILKKELEQTFLGLPEIFVSSDSESISIGTRWLDQIDHALGNAQVVLLLCSQNSVKRPWINFEAGAGWVKKIPVVPICHTNIKPTELPIPLNMLQAIEVTNADGLKEVFKLVGAQLGVKKTPEIAYERIIREIKDFEINYGVIQVVRYHVSEIIRIESRMSALFEPNSPNRNASGHLTEIKLDKLMPHFKKLSEMGFLDYGTGGNRMTFGASGGGNEIEFNLLIKQLYYDIAEKVIN